MEPKKTIACGKSDITDYGTTEINESLFKNTMIHFKVQQVNNKQTNFQL